MGRMRMPVIAMVLLLFGVVANAGEPGSEPARTAEAGDTARTDVFRPAYVSPQEMLALLGAREAEGHWRLTFPSQDGAHVVDIWSDDAANLLVLVGDRESLDRFGALAHALDTAPRQIQIEARIVEIDTDQASDLGIDWSRLRGNADLSQAVQRQLTTQYMQVVPGFSSRTYDRRTNDTRQADSRLVLDNALSLLQQKGAATFRDAPSVLTLNNRPATIFDGTHQTYVNRAAAYANIYQTESFDAGLKLDVTPTRAESGYLKLRLHAEMTSLASGGAGSLVVSPAKEGQQVDDVVMAKDGQTVLLGGFSHNVQSKVHTRFPVLGSLLPFLFSRDVVQERHHAIFIAITPRMVALDAQPAEDVRRALGDK